MNEQIPNCFYRVSAKALILDENQRFLLAKEDNGYRDFPGGWLDFGEDPRAGIEREIQEETWVKTTYIAAEPAYFITVAKPEKNCRLAHVFYETKIKNLDFVKSKECTELKFFSKEEAGQELIYGQVKAFIKHFDPKNHR